MVQKAAKAMNMLIANTGHAPAFMIIWMYEIWVGIPMNYGDNSSNEKVLVHRYLLRGLATSTWKLDRMFVDSAKLEMCAAFFSAYISKKMVFGRPACSCELSSS